MSFAPWEWLLSLLGTLLAFFYDIIPEYGIAIILLTLTVSLLLFPLTVKQTRSMKAMQEIQPEVKKLQKELKGDKEELNKHLMELYKERGVNPAAGCLPLIVQMPIWFALYRVLWQGHGIPADSPLSQVLTEAGSELYDTVDGVRTLVPNWQELGGEAIDSVKFLGMNLLVKPSDAVSLDNIVGSLPYLIMIAIIVAAGFYQQVQTSRKRTDAPQQEQNSQMEGMQKAMKIMPFVFGFITWNFVTGLGLYFATSNLFRVGQQAFILRLGDSGGSSGKAEPSAADDPDPSDTPPNGNGPSPNASKKRNRRRKK